VVPYLKASLLSDIHGIRHGFFTRQGGVSQGDFASLNADPAKENQPDHVQENRRRISESLGFEAKNLVTARQVHSSEVVVVARPFEGNLPEADALISVTPGLLVGVLTADCVPVLLSTPTGDMVAAVHAGWRGAVSGILEATVQKMKDLGARQVVAALGPCIWQESYEVSQEFYDNLPTVPFLFKAGNRPHHWQFDLPGYVMHHLSLAGVEHVSPSLANTYADADRFFSFRRKTILGEAHFGNILSGIGILGKMNF
jgi:YfiH family protein